MLISIESLMLDEAKSGGGERAVPRFAWLGVDQ